VSRRGADCLGGGGGREPTTGRLTRREVSVVLV
jgi:hypothetical protein